MKAAPEAAAAAEAAGSPRHSSIRKRAAQILGLLFGTGLVALLVEESVLNYTQAQRRRAFAANADDSRLFHHDLVDPPEELEPEAWMKQESEEEVPSDDRLHLSLLQAACVANREAIVSWTYGKPGENQQSDIMNQKELILKDDPELLEKLRQCPDVDVFLPAGLRGHGYCEDATVYAKFLKSRLLPSWAIDTPLFDAKLGRTITYHELCPRTPIVLFNHYWHDIHVAPDFPKNKPVYLMPNVEMYELNEKHYWNVDVILCKTRDCYNRLTQWYAQEGNPRNTKVFYTKHTSSDVANFAKMRLGLDAIAPKDFVNPRFIHTAGGSVQKGTAQVLDCWLSRPDFPPLDFYIHESNYKNNYEEAYGKHINASLKINLTTHNIDSITFGKAIAEASFFLCASLMEGYGHYINQARVSGGVIVTTNAPPMNELIPSSDMGVYVESTRRSDPNTFLGGAYKGAHGLKRIKGMVAWITKEEVCKAVERVVFSMTASKRQEMAAKAQRQYHIDTKFFARRMLQLRHFAVLGPNHRFPELIAASSSAAQDPVAAVSRLRREEEGGSS